MKRWTPDEVSFLLSARKLSISFGKIAMYLGRTPDACHTKYYNETQATPKIETRKEILTPHSYIEHHPEPSEEEKLMLARAFLREKHYEIEEGNYLWTKRSGISRIVPKFGDRIILNKGDMEDDTCIVWIQKDGEIKVLIEDE